MAWGDKHIVHHEQSFGAFWKECYANQNSLTIHKRSWKIRFRRSCNCTALCYSVRFYPTPKPNVLRIPNTLYCSIPFQILVSFPFKLVLVRFLSNFEIVQNCMVVQLQNWYAILNFHSAISKLCKFANCTEHMCTVQWETEMSTKALFDTFTVLRYRQGTVLKVDKCSRRRNYWESADSLA